MASKSHLFDTPKEEKKIDLFDSLFGHLDAPTVNKSHQNTTSPQTNEGLNIFFDPILSLDQNIEPPTNTNQSNQDDFLSLFDWTIPSNKIPYHPTHHGAKYADMGCKQCIEYRNKIPSHNDHFYNSQYAEMGCKTCQCSQSREEFEIAKQRKYWKQLHEEKLNKWEYDTTIDIKRQNLLGFGYIRFEERKHKLSYDIPNGIKNIISMYIEIYNMDGKRRNIRILIYKLPSILNEALNSKHKPIPLTKLLDQRQLKKGYFKCMRLVHPDKSYGRGDTIESQVICDHVFNAMEHAYNDFLK